MRTETEVRKKYAALKSDLDETNDLLIDFPDDEAMKRSRDRIQKECWDLEWVLNLNDED